MQDSNTSRGLEPRIGLFGATMVGVGAMVGAGIFVLCGVAMREAGPGAMLAFALNGVLTLITAFSFAELAAASCGASGRGRGGAGCSARSRWTWWRARAAR